MEYRELIQNGAKAFHFRSIALYRQVQKKAHDIGYPYA